MYRTMYAIIKELNSYKILPALQFEIKQKRGAPPLTVHQTIELILGWIFTLHLISKEREWFEEEENCRRTDESLN